MLPGYNAWAHLAIAHLHFKETDGRTLNSLKPVIACGNVKIVAQANLVFLSDGMYCLEICLKCLMVHLDEKSGWLFMFAICCNHQNLPLNCKNIDHRSFKKLLPFISQGTLFYMPWSILTNMANIKQSQSLFTRGAPTCKMKAASLGMTTYILVPTSMDVKKNRKNTLASGNPSGNNQIPYLN